MRYLTDPRPLANKASEEDAPVGKNLLLSRQARIFETVPGCVAASQAIKCTEKTCKPQQAAKRNHGMKVCLRKSCIHWCRADSELKHDSP